MNPAFLDNMSWEMAEVYGAVTDRILINLAKYFKYYKPGEPVPRSTFEYQARMLAQMGQVSKETMQIIRNGLDGADEALKNTLEQAVIDAVSKAEPELLDAVKKGVLSPAGMQIVAPNQMQAFQRYYQQAADKLNLVNTVMLESTKSAYQQAVSGVIADIELAERVGATQFALDAATGEVVTGVSSWNQALKNATEHMANRGITGFVDHGGHQWSAEAYAAMDIRTTVANTARAAVWETNQNFGNDLYSVSYHNGARPGCYPWQNKVVSSTDNARTVTDLDGNEIVVVAQSATSYGQPAGLFGINCKHYPTPFIPGVSLIRGEPQSPEENAKTYEESQHQRALERKIREQKRDLDMMKAQGASPEAIKAQRAKIRETDDEIDAFCEQTGRARRQNREAVYTKREFPDKERYDVSKFEHEQKDRIREYYEKGGAQHGYTFGQMTPNEDDSIESLERQYNEINAKKRAFIREHRFDDNDEWRSQVVEYNKKLDELTEKSVAKEKAQKAAENEAKREAERKAQRAKEDSIRKKAIEDYDVRIDEIERKRMDLLYNESSDIRTSDKLYEELEKLEERKRIVENGGWTLDQATVTQKPFVVNPGTTSEISLKQADIYTMPDGKQFVFKHGMDRAKQKLTPDELITKYYEVPKAVRDKSQNVIAVVDRYNPNDAYWKKEYKRLGYDFPGSYATGGKQMTFYRWDYEHDPEYMLFTIEHEAGHAIDITEGNISTSAEWLNAIAKDKEIAGESSFRDYGATRTEEDFADSVGYYSMKNAEFRKRFPNRSTILDRIIGGGQ